MVFACSIYSNENSNLHRNPNFRSACEAFGTQMRQTGCLLAVYEGGALGVLERRQYGEVSFEELNSEAEKLSALWLIDARDLNHMIALFDRHPVLSSFGVRIRALTSEGDWRSGDFASII